MKSEQFPLDTPFKPSRAIITWFTTNYVLLMAFIIVVILLPLVYYGEISWDSFNLVLVIIAISIVLFAIWARLYYDSMWYELHDDEMRWKRGVIFRRTGIVPYNRVTNIDVKQGPVMRPLSISTVSIQTAGYSGKGVPEISIEGIVHAEELRELLRTMVRVCSGGDGTGSGGTVAPQAMKPADLQQVLVEMRAIRALLEEKL
ncbi:MAG: PH domain-containing protein [Methanomicrobiales archaeon]|nr:PH domain-containing protein [Methanomicrobiales archaeon]